MKDTKLNHFNPRALLDKYSIGGKKRERKPNYSSFWMDNDWDSRRTSIFDDEDYVKPKVDHIALAGYRRAVSNFVNIVTGDPTIKVTFNSNDDSYTDGKTVVIGSKMDDKLFDSSVGLALHEGSHIKLSDFDLVRNLESNIPTEYFVRGEMKGFSKMEILSHIKNLLNYVEDRRIDFHIFSTSPGYKGYYHSMYDKYFHSKVIDKALVTDEYTTENWDSYIFRILNMTNKNTNLRALKGLGLIYNLVFKNNGGIKNLKTTMEAFEVALGIYDIILVNIPDGKEKVDKDTGEVTYEKADEEGESGETTSGEGNSSGTEDSNKLSDDEFDSLIESIENGEMGSGGSSEGGKSIEVDLSMGGGSSEGGTDVGKETKKVELSDRQKKMLEKAIEKQKDFNNGDVKKTGKLTKKDARAVKTMEEAGVTNVKAGEGVSGDYDYKSGKYFNKGTNVIVVKKFTKSMVEADLFPSLMSNNSYYSYYYRKDSNNENIKKGIVLGTMLGKKLQVRGESRNTKWTRKDSGRIDKRLIAELGFGNESVFETTFVESYSDAFIHISVDASGSMGGEKWDNTMVSTVAICKAASMISNVDVVVSFRTTHNGGNSRRSSMYSPLILIAYDSRVDKFSKIKNLFPYLHHGGTTPEGLCFEAIMDEIIPSTKDRDSYFLNFSDGMPMFSNDDISYYYDDALNHTKKMVNEMRMKGIKVLSYFIGDGYGDDKYMKDFKTMYGKDAEMIDVTNVMSVSKTMNKKFLSKN